MFGNLPSELIENVLSYDGSWKIRNGIYMRQIPKDDSRFGLFENIPKPRIKKTPNCVYIAVDFEKKLFFENLAYNDPTEYRRDPENQWMLLLLDEDRTTHLGGDPRRSLRIHIIENKRLNTNHLFYVYDQLLQDNNFPHQSHFNFLMV